MMTRNIYTIRGDLPSSDYAALLQGLAPLALSFGLIVRSRSLRLADTALSVMRSLEALLVSIDEVAKWPGTELIGGRRSLLYTYRLEPESLNVLVESASSLFQWVNPQLPEDLHLIRSDGTVVLGTMAQEADAWMELNDLEVEQLWAEAPATLRKAINNRADDELS